MQLREITYGDVAPIESHGPGFIRLRGAVIRAPLLLCPQSVGRWGGFEDLAPILALAGEIDILLVGTGREITPLPPGFRAPLEAAGMALEVMGSGPAARVYNVLLAEGRRMALALQAS